MNTDEPILTKDDLFKHFTPKELEAYSLSEASIDEIRFQVSDKRETRNLKLILHKTLMALARQKGRLDDPSLS